MSNYIRNLIDGAENTTECMEHYAELVGFSNQEKNHSPAVEPWAQAELSIERSSNASFAQQWYHFIGNIFIDCIDPLRISQSQRLGYNED